MRDAFAGFCDALFNQELRDITVARLRSDHVLAAGSPTPETREDRVALVRRADPGCLLELIYRFQFISDERDYQNISSYVNNAPLLNQFVHEFIQNAEDSSAVRCRFVFDDDRVVVVNDGQSFTPENLYAICSFRESDKATQQRGLQIGKFGVGFKSVFRVTRSPVVVTWDDARGAPLAFRFFVPGEFDGEYHSRLDAEAPFLYSPRVPEGERREFPAKIGFLFRCPWHSRGTSPRPGRPIEAAPPAARCFCYRSGPTCRRGSGKRSSSGSSRSRSFFSGWRAWRSRTSAADGEMSGGGRRHVSR